MTRGRREGGRRSGREDMKRDGEELNNGRYESGHRKKQPNSSGPKECEALQRMNHASQRALFSVCGGKAGTRGMFVLLNDHTICLLFTQTVPGSFWGETLCSWEVRNDPALILITSFFFCHRVNPLGVIFLAWGDRRTAWRILNGEFNKSKSARSSASKKGLKERSPHETLMLLQRVSSDSHAGETVELNGRL